MPPLQNQRGSFGTNRLYPPKRARIRALSANRKRNNPYTNRNSMTRQLKFRAWSHKFQKFLAVGFHIIGETTLFDLLNQHSIKELDTVSQARALAKLEVKLASLSGKPKVSKAPEPIKPVSVTVMSGEVTPEKDVAAWVAQRNAQAKWK